MGNYGCVNEDSQLNAMGLLVVTYFKLNLILLFLSLVLRPLVCKRNSGPTGWQGEAFRKISSRMSFFNTNVVTFGRVYYQLVFSSPGKIAVGSCALYTAQIVAYSGEYQLAKLRQKTFVQRTTSSTLSEYAQSTNRCDWNAPI